MPAVNWTIQLAYDTHANFTGANPILKEGQLVIVTDGGGAAPDGTTMLRCKVGSGAAYNSTPFTSFGDFTGWANALLLKLNTADTTSTPTAGKVPVAGVGGVLANGWIPPAPAQYSIAPISGAAAVHQWVNMPAALTFFLGQARWFIAADLTNRTQIRLVGGTLGTAASASAKLRILYKTQASTYSATIGDYSTIGTSEVQITLGTSINVIVDSGWIDIAAGAKGKVLIALAGIDGDGTADPGFSGIWIEVK